LYHLSLKLTRIQAPSSPILHTGSACSQILVQSRMIKKTLTSEEAQAHSQILVLKSDQRQDSCQSSVFSCWKANAKFDFKFMPL